MTDDPTRRRPAIPASYGIDQGPEGMLEWDAVSSTIDAAEIYWVSSALPNGEPHLVPIHAGSIDGIVHLTGDPVTRWARNLAANPAVHVGVDHDGLQVMIRGAARQETPAPERFEVLNANLASKYEWQLEGDPIPVWTVHPAAVLAFDPGRFASSPTRFSFTENP